MYFCIVIFLMYDVTYLRRVGFPGVSRDRWEVCLKLGDCLLSLAVGWFHGGLFLMLVWTIWKVRNDRIF